MRKPNRENGMTSEFTNLPTLTEWQLKPVLPQSSGA